MFGDQLTLHPMDTWLRLHVESTCGFFERFNFSKSLSIRISPHNVGFQSKHFLQSFTQSEWEKNVPFLDKLFKQNVKDRYVVVDISKVLDLHDLIIKDQDQNSETTDKARW